MGLLPAAAPYRDITPLSNAPVGADVVLQGKRYHGRQATVWSKGRYDITLIVEGGLVGIEQDFPRSTPCELLGSYSPHVLYPGTTRRAVPIFRRRRADRLVATAA